MKYTYKKLEDDILLTTRNYLAKFTEKPLEINYGFCHFIGDPRDENVLEKYIRDLKSTVKLGILGGEDKDVIIEKIEKTSLMDNKDSMYHAGYLHYLLCAWENHMGIEIGPWHLWTILLWNLKEFNKGAPEKFKKLWTTNGSKEKQQIVIEDDNFDIVDVYGELKKYIPSDTLDSIVLQFDDNPDLYLESMYTLIGEISEDYYSVLILACNIPEVRVLGSEDEWIKMRKQLDKVKNLYGSQDITETTIIRYLDQVGKLFDQCIQNYSNQEFWLDFFKIEKCGSGSQQEIAGHIQQLFPKEILINSLPKIVGRFSYSFIPDANVLVGANPIKKAYVSGVLSSHKDGNILVPKFDYMMTSLDEDVYNVDEETVEKTLNLIRAVQQLNSYSRDPVFHAYIDENGFLKTLDNEQVLLGKVSLDSYLEYQKQKNEYLDVERTKENFQRAQEKYKGYTTMGLLDDLVVQKDERLDKYHKNNFWCSVSGRGRWRDPIIITTEDWLRGRKLQTEEDIDNLCQNLPTILDGLEFGIRTDDPIQKCNYEVEQYLQLIIPTYHEKVYQTFCEYVIDRYMVCKTDVYSMIIERLFTHELQYVTSSKKDQGYDTYKYRLSVLNGKGYVGSFSGEKYPVISRTMCFLLCRDMLGEEAKDGSVVDSIYNALMGRIVNHLSSNSMLNVMDMILNKDNYLIIQREIHMILLYLSTVKRYATTVTPEYILNGALRMYEYPLRLKDGQLYYTVKTNETVLDYISDKIGFPKMGPKEEVEVPKNVLNFIDKIRHFTSSFKQHLSPDSVSRDSIRADKDTVYDKKMNYWYYNELVDRDPTELRPEEFTTCGAMKEVGYQTYQFGNSIVDEQKKKECEENRRCWITYDRWKDKVEKQYEFLGLDTDDFDEIVKVLSQMFNVSTTTSSTSNSEIVFGASGEKELWEHIFWTLNVDIYVSFVENYKSLINMKSEIGFDNYLLHFYADDTDGTINSCEGRIILLLNKIVKIPSGYSNWMDIEPKIKQELCENFCSKIANKGMIKKVVEVMISRLENLIKYVYAPWKDPLENRPKYYFNTRISNEHVIKLNKNSPIRKAVDLIKMCIPYVKIKGMLKLDEYVLSEIVEKATGLKIKYPPLDKLDDKPSVILEDNSEQVDEEDFRFPVV